MDILNVSASIVGGGVVCEDGIGYGAEGRAFGKKAAERDKPFNKDDYFRV